MYLTRRNSALRRSEDDLYQLLLLCQHRRCLLQTCLLQPSARHSIKTVRVNVCLLIMLLINVVANQCALLIPQINVHDSGACAQTRTTNMSYSDKVPVG